MNATARSGIHLPGSHIREPVLRVFQLYEHGHRSAITHRGEPAAFRGLQLRMGFLRGRIHQKLA